MAAWGRGLVVLGIASACTNEDKVLAELAGGWTGTIAADAGPIGVGGALTFEEETGLLSGTFAVADPGQAHTYAVRRWTVARGEVFLDLTDVTQATRALDLDGEVGEAFSGTATVTYPCDTGTCGYVGEFSLTRGDPPLTVTTTDTGPPTDTGLPPTDTGLPPTDTGAPPTDTGAPTDTGLP